MNKTIFAKLALCVAAFAALPATANDFTVRFDLHGQTIDAKPLSSSKDRMLMLARDGNLLDFDPRHAANYSKISSSFRSYSQAEVRQLLLQEFGRQFEVSGTGQFLVVHPVGKRNQWAQRFEDLYRSFVRYFTIRGLTIQRAQFPLVAVVFERRSDFISYAAKSGSKVPPGVLGFYSPKTNRILMYDQNVGSSDQSNWQSNATTLIHEAAHQSAFNTGIHNRLAPPPRWVAEGLGMMFESPGVWDSGHYTQQRDRINYGRMKSFKQYAATSRNKGALAELVSSDRIFQFDPQAAYAEAWAVTFYLAETQPRKYFDYLAKTGARPKFKEYRSPDRLRDFTSVFGSNLGMIEARMLRFVDELQ